MPSTHSLVYLARRSLIFPISNP
ncbi:hypothetical protein LINGRAPRIM_LOCUS2907 [Linum grandiflorum]